MLDGSSFSHGGIMNRRTVAVAVVLAVILAGGIYFVRKNQSFSAPVVKNWEKSKGPVNAPVQIIEYSDFECPACMKAQPALAALMLEYPEKIRIIFRHYPLPMHKWAGVAHQAAECANVQGKFWEFHDLVYQTQPIWTAAPNAPEYLITFAKNVGVDLDKFGACLSDASVTKRILEERAAGSELKLSSTPTFFINGERVVGQIELENQGRNVVRKILGLPPLPPKLPAVSIPAVSVPPVSIPAPQSLPAANLSAPARESLPPQNSQN